jgi:glycosyltransferase involved in cell wall biosynthesis
MQISLIMPAYNEEERIGKFLTSLLKCFPSEEIIVVCNGCTDRTPEIVKSFCKKHRNITLLVYKEKIGKGAAIVEGFKRANGEYVGFVDADGTFGCKEIKRVLKRLRYADCVIASKWKGQSFSSVEWPVTRKIFSRLWNLMVRFFLHLNFDDTQAGLKFVKKNVLKSIDFNFICRGYDFDVEFLLKIRKKGFDIEEVFTKVRHTGDTSFSFVSIPKMFVNLLRLCLRI